MNDENLVTRCGIYCGACYIYRAQRDGEEFLYKIAEWQKVEQDEVKCEGCLSPDEAKWPNCIKCYPQKCLKEKKLDYCYECDEFIDQSCSFYKELEEFCSKRGENIRENMIKIKEDTLAWLSEQKEKWNCPSCGKPYSWYETTCHHCGENLNRIDIK